jgi:MSHA pilin protein MshD
MSMRPSPPRTQFSRLTRPPSPPRSSGFTLIELIVAITIVAIAATTLMGAIAAISSRSADAMLQQQAIAIAQAYLDEIEQRWVVDPNGTPTNTGRGSWDLVDQYNGLSDVGAHDQYGNAITGLSAYNVTVSVSHSSALPNIPSTAARRIDVTVTTSPNVSVTLSGYRTNY